MFARPLAKIIPLRSLPLADLAPGVAVGPTGPAAALPDDVFASYLNPQTPLTVGDQISLLPFVTDPTGQITLTSATRIALAAGYYLVFYKVSALFHSPNYMQITPCYNNAPHLEAGIYFANTANGSSATGSAHFILYAPTGTTFSLIYSGSANAIDGEANLTFFKAAQTRVNP